VGREPSGSLLSLREQNRDRVVETLRELGVASRAEIARRTGLSRSTVSSLVSELQAEGTVVDNSAEAGGSPAQAGRPPQMISLGRRAGAAIGIDFGKRHLAVAAADLSHEIIAEERQELAEGYDAATGFDTAQTLVAEVIDETGLEREELLGVGLGLPGPIHRVTGQVGSATILPGWVGLAVAEEMERRIGLPVHVDNDANLGALAELYWGAGQGADELIYLKVATGVGAGFVFGGRLFYGAGGTAGEIGHMTTDETGPLCRCGNRGCLETFAGAPAIVELIRSSLGEELAIGEIAERADADDASCRRAMADAGRHIGNALADVCNLFNPERVVVGGTVGQACRTLRDAMGEAVRQRAIRSAADDVEIVPGVLGERAEVLGAVALFLGRAEVRAQPSTDRGAA
jgi:predicted NBD/HSP70 family sugar kinase/biotin operon repressor